MKVTITFKCLVRNCNGSMQIEILDKDIVVIQTEIKNYEKTVQSKRA